MVAFRSERWEKWKLLLSLAAILAVSLLLAWAGGHGLGPHEYIGWLTD